MRWYVKSSERKPDPAPVKTDDRAAILVGLVLWILALCGMLIGLRPLVAGGHEGWLWTAVVAITLGLVGLVYAQIRRGRVRRREEAAAATAEDDSSEP
ncbi:DUF2530 domain-containing protein [Schumannella sp. 10F1B-5-1]|uniref:DUF2530 domain-containing protein n=1 Tax=Schumannella sp. 10F1B-5-1 TaxID=2590780 RepID=UPI001130B192|nr:DUF2530 domain-containing protein [Schumannella sp. 10F1B-5-1]TPW72878.1 DUF2530 domain-containing protein [Schumannella sp. 10F1B-5-1]